MRLDLVERSAPITRREVVVVAVVGSALSAILNWRIFGGFASAVPADSRDPLLEAWSIAWSGHALVHQPLQFFDSNAFWPLSKSLAFSDSLAGYAPVGLLGGGTTAALVHYNLLFLFSYALAFAGAYLLAREVGVSRLAAFVAGCAFAWTPARTAQMPHLHVLSSGGIALALFLLLRGWRRQSAWSVLAGWAVAAWQVSLGWNLGLPFVYLLAVGALIATAMIAARRLSVPPRGVLVALAVGGLVFAAVALALARPYVQVLSAHPEARRTPETLFHFSPPPRGLLAAPPENLVWGAATAWARHGLEAANEQELFPGLAIVVLAVLGAAAGHLPRRLRVALAAAALVSALLSLGFGFHGGKLGYRWLFDYAPGWEGLRTPGRLSLFTALALALLAAAGVDRLADALRGRRLQVAAGVLVAGLILVEGYGRMTMFDAPGVPAGTAEVASPRLYLPFANGANEGLYMYWSTRGFPEMPNGWSGFEPTEHNRLALDMAGFPDRQSVAAARRLGIRTVILDPRLAAGTAWAGAAGRPVSGLAIRRTQVGRVLVYSL